MSSNGLDNPPFLVVGNRVYVKGDDGVFCPGIIEAKMDNYGYMVRLANDKRKQAREEDLIWLGFYGLPSSCWPENPVVQPTSSSEETFEGTMKFVGNTSPKWPASFTLRKLDENEQYSLGSDCAGAEKSLRLDEEAEKPTQTLHARISEEERVKQPRSSVIRLNRDLLHTERSCDLIHHRPSMISLNETTNLIPGYIIENNSELQNKYSIHKISPLHYAHESLCSNKVTVDTGGGRRRETTEQIRDWGKKFSLNQSNLTSPTAARVDCSSPRGLPVIRTIHASVARAESSMENTPSCRGQTPRKRKKQGDTKKCRKVYGIDNRQAWCTQCRWKKACTQFQECDKKILDIA